MICRAGASLPSIRQAERLPYKFFSVVHVDNPARRRLGSMETARHRPIRAGNAFSG